jgi:putative acetyltransferase
MKLMEIVDYRPGLAGAFKALNEAWITQLFALEPKDVEVLDDPAGKVIAPGGQIVFVLDGDEAVGCCALMAMPDGGFEVAKMAVADSHKGRGLGRVLMNACIQRAKAAGAPRLYLETNSALAPALGLYRSFGFQSVDPPAPSPYARADVTMELRLPCD